MNGTRRKWVGAAIGAGVLVAVLLSLASRDQLPQVTTARATRETLDAWISSNGKVEPIEAHDLRAEVETFVQVVAVTEGQAAKRGQLLLQLDSTDASARLAKARQDLIAAQEDLRNARAGGNPEALLELESNLSKAQANRDHLAEEQKELERLVSSQAATQDELDGNKLALARAEADLKFYTEKMQDLARRAQLEVKQATFRTQQAQAEVQSLEEKIRSARMISPIDGTVYALPVHRGDYVHVGDLLVEVADLHRVRVRAFVDEPDLGWLEPGEAVEISWDALPNRVWLGSTEQIPKQVVARGTRSVGEVLCSVDNQNLELLPNINVDVRIRVRQQKEAVVVPRSAIRGEGTDHYVFLVEDGRLQKRRIQVGIASATKYEVLQGLTQGDEVALPGEVELRDGLEVHAVEQP